MPEVVRLVDRNKRIREALERWARWRHFRYGGYGKTLTEKFIEGMPGTRCPTCAGRGKRGREQCPTCEGAGRVRLDPGATRVRVFECRRCERGEINGRTCHWCRGSGVRTVVDYRINPAHIRSTYLVPDDPVCQRIDRLVCEMKRRETLLGYWFVVNAEYVDGRGGTQADKAQRMLLTADCYESRLRRALEWIGYALHDRRPADVIPFPYKAA